MTHTRSIRPSSLLGLIGAVLLLPACSWDFGKLSVNEFRRQQCKVLDNFKKNAQDNCKQIGDPAQRDACYQSINAQLLALALAKGQAVSAYANCNEARLKAAERTANRIIDAIIRELGGGLKNPLKRLRYNAVGQKTAGPGPQQMVVQQFDAVLVADAVPTDPLQIHGQMMFDFQPTPQGYNGPVLDVQWQADLLGLAVWNIQMAPSPHNEFDLFRTPTGFQGQMRCALLVDGPGITETMFVQLPLEMSLDEMQWSSTSGGMVPADPFFPVLPEADVRIGHGCLGSNGQEPEINPISITRVGDPMLVRLENAIPNTVGSLNLSFAPLPLPIDLGFLGAPGCDALLLPDLTLFAPIGPSGSGDFGLPIPPDPALANVDLFLQGLVIDPQANQLGVVTTGGLKQTIDPR